MNHKTSIVPVRRYPQTRDARPRLQFDLKPKERAAANKCAEVEERPVASIARDAFLSYLRREGYLPRSRSRE